jgi:hypothetical protein
VRGRRVGSETNTDTWRNLAAAVLLQAIDDATGRHQWVYEAAARDRLIAGAQRWLLSESGAALLTALDLDCEAVLGALTHPAHKARHESPRIPQPRRRRRTA